MLVILFAVANPGRIMVLSDGTGGGVGGPVTSPGGAGDGGGLIAPRRLINPCLESSPRQDLHRELMFNQKMYVLPHMCTYIHVLYHRSTENTCTLYIADSNNDFVHFSGKNVLNQKSELERALSKHKEKQVINQEKDQKEAPGILSELYLHTYIHIDC